MEIRDHPYLYQWDRGRELSVPEENAVYVDFARSGTDEPLRIAVTDGVAKIPDSWLQIAGNRNVYVCYIDGTMQGYTLMVRPRPKPPDYLATPDEAWSYATLEKKVQEIGQAVEQVTGGTLELVAVMEDGSERRLTLYGREETADESP